MKHETLKIKKVLHGPCSMLYDSRGYIALFSFLAMSAVLAVLAAVFGLLVSRGIFMARTGAAELENIYAAEAAAEDAIFRIKNTAWSNPASGETLTVGRSVVNLTVTGEAPVKSYLFSAGINNKYFENEILTLDGVGPSAKIKLWQDSF